jgi:hypothetical protein
MKLSQPGFTSKQWSAIVNALHVAAVQYQIDAATMSRHGHTRTGAQFVAQSQEAIAIAEAIEQADDE